MYFPCSNCGQRVFLFRGLCNQCAPELHANLQGEIDLVGEMESAFEKATGKTALEAWTEYEKFIDDKYSQKFTKTFEWRG